MKKRNRLKFLIIILIIAVLLISGFFIFQMMTKKVITFKTDKLTIEYGDEFDFVSTIESLDPEDAEITYPDIEVKEVGTYHLTFKINVNGKESEQQETFVVQDTKFPDVVLKNDESVEVMINSNYDITSNIADYQNVSEEAKANLSKVEQSDYDTMKENIEKTQEEVANREISSKEDIKTYDDIFHNGLLYTTNLDLSTTGTYDISLLVVDENYNVDELTWKIDVVESGQIVNSGGVVTAVYPNDSLQTNDAYTTDYTEIYHYNEKENVTIIDFVTVMTFKEDYTTDENKQLLMDTINQSYADYKDKAGIVVDINAGENNVTTIITVTLADYDYESDLLNLFEENKKGNININDVVKSLKDTTSLTFQ